MPFLVNLARSAHQVLARDTPQASRPMTKMTIDQAIQIAFRHHQAGRTAEAETICRQVLIQAPDHAHALHLLGVLSGHAGHNEAAIELIGRAVAINPSVAQYRSNLGELYRRARRWEEALIQFTHAVELAPGMAAAHNGLGVVLRNMGRVNAAIAAFARAIGLEAGLPRSPQ